MIFQLPPSITNLVNARNELREHFQRLGLTFTFDGKLVGDIGEAIAAIRYGIDIIVGAQHGIDGHAPDDRSVQIKATGTNRGPAFRRLELENRAQHLLFFSFDFDNATGEIIYNGPEAFFLENAPEEWQGQRSFPMNYAIARNLEVPDDQRLPLIANA